MGGFEFYFDQKIKTIVCVIIVAWKNVVNHLLATSCEILVVSAKFLGKRNFGPWQIIGKVEHMDQWSDHSSVRDVNMAKGYLQLFAQ